jgi:hypothetical protein
MPSREEAKSVIQKLHALSGSAEIVRKAAARELARRDPLDANELLHEVIFLARGGWEPATCVLSAFVTALGREAASIPYADSMRRMAEVQSLASVADLFETAPAKKEFDEGAAAKADAKLLTQSLGHLKQPGGGAQRAPQSPPHRAAGGAHGGAPSGPAGAAGGDLEVAALVLASRGAPGARLQPVPAAGGRGEDRPAAQRE